MRGIIYDFKLSRPQVESPKGMSPQDFFSFLVYSFRRQVLWDTTSHLDTVEFRGCISRCGKVFDAISDPKFGGPFFEVKSLSHHLHHQFWLQTKTSHTTATIHLRLAFLFFANNCKSAFSAKWEQDKAVVERREYINQPDILSEDKRTRVQSCYQSARDISPCRLLAKHSILLESSTLYQELLSRLVPTWYNLSLHLTICKISTLHSLHTQKVTV